MKEAMLYEKLSDTEVQCNLCNHRCTIKDGNYGICGVRQNVDGSLFSLVYGRIVAAHIDPIEKNPCSSSIQVPGAIPLPLLDAISGADTARIVIYLSSRGRRRDTLLVIQWGQRK